MESNKIFVVILALLVISVNGQISTPCTASMISSFTPCINFITGSTNNGSTPSSSCCNSLKSLMDTSRDCACLLITASVSFQLPINPTLGISLPRACNMSGVPLQCKATGSPLPAPGPELLGPILPPLAAPALSPKASKASTASAPAPEPETTTPPSPPEAPETTPGVRPVLTPPASGAEILKYSPHSALLILLLSMVFRYN
ncbi:non-specific lipid transfer protein GPI-anchored 2 [Tripterygium wilfordii]|uniref:non-specific lipid transfer protein GPI-anchored 2 n=1 Tax=Tripterygium wilfordii TaxID=458696 RepID=UPI0018F7F687|nr:non-specific lipid transfer protein GPI-anchored 2 [Tripterygium wilfordii]